MLLTNKAVTILFSIILLVSTNITKANDGIAPTVKQLNVTVLSAGKVQIETFANDKTATYEIEKSYDNKNFTTVAMVLPNDAVENNKAIFLKDTVKTNKKKVYYRLKITSSTGTNIAATNKVIL